MATLMGKMVHKGNGSSSPFNSIVKSSTGFARKVGSLCNLCVLCVSVVHYYLGKNNHGDTENTEVAQRKLSKYFSCKASSTYKPTQQQRNDYCRNYGDEAGQHEAVIEQVLSNPCRSGLVERHGCQQRPIRWQKKDPTRRRIKRSQ